MKNKKTSQPSCQTAAPKVIFGQGQRPEGLTKKNLPAYSKDGVDLMLIRWMLSLTPAERLEVLQNGTLGKKIRLSARLRGKGNQSPKKVQSKISRK
jgi:hypothetical protein